MDKNIRIDEIVTRLNAASDAYYGGQEEQMTNYEWDALFDELTALEKATGYVRPDSPTQVTSHSGNEMDGEGEKEAHEYPALSLAKTKKVEELQDWAGERDIWLSWKLDGSTLVATYDGGALTRVLTRGNGTVGTNITYMASTIRGIPAKISDKGHLVVRGEHLLRRFRGHQRHARGRGRPLRKPPQPRRRHAGARQDESRQGERAQRDVQRLYARPHG